MNNIATRRGVTEAVGYRAFLSDEPLNYQLNRWLPTMDEAEVWEAAPRIGSLADWRTEMIGLGHRAEAAGRALHASTYYRAAEFFMTNADRERTELIGKYLALFDEAVSDWPIERHEVPFEGGALPVLAMRAAGAPRDTLVIHGGFDSYKEELFMSAPAYADAGFDVVVFDGPGQGQAFRRHGLTLLPQWERPVSAVLDHLAIDSCTLMGFSLGGYLAPRAAAFEKRVRRLVVNDVLCDFLDCYMARATPEVAARIVALLDTGDRAAANTMVAAMSGASPNIRWAIEHGCEVSGASDGFEFLLWLRELRTAPFADRIDQDVLLLAAKEDHIVPLHQFYRQISDLPNVSSLTAQLFTRADHAHAHCHVGALPLVTDYVLSWLTFRLNADRVRKRSGGPG